MGTEGFLVPGGMRSGCWGWASETIREIIRSTALIAINAHASISLIVLGNTMLCGVRAVHWNRLVVNTESVAMSVGVAE